jgi:manganese transport protein
MTATTEHPTSSAGHDVLDGVSGRKTALGRLLPFLGPAFIASVAYVDPGNFATNIEGGARFGYTLVWVIVASDLFAMLIQLLSAKLGIATGLNLAELCRDRFPRPVVLTMWVIMEIAAMATDLAEFLGAAIGFNLLFGMPLLPAGILTAAVTFLILGFERYGFRSIEVIISIFVGAVAVCYLAELVFSRPDMGEVIGHILVPRFAGTESVLVATGILGATVMPHAIYLHSALMQGRIVVRDPVRLRKLFRYEIADVLIAMTIAGFVNIAMLVTSASAFFATGTTGVSTIEEAHRAIEPLLGAAAGWVFAVALLAAGLSSSSVGTMAGQIIMQGFIRRKISPLVRRAATMIPSLAVIAAGLDPTRSLVMSQVVLSFALPFAVVPLVMFTSRKDIMGVLVNARLTTAAAIGISALILLLNAFLLVSIMYGG